jgi:alpha-L-fucosidase
VVSKNGNLLLSVPQRGDGSIDGDCEAILESLARWTAANGSAIYGTRPWRIYGEGPTRPQAGFQNEGAALPFTGADVRYTTGGAALNAILLHWPQGEAALTALGSRALPEAVVERVETMDGTPLPFTRDAGALHFRLPPPETGTFVPAIRIRGRGIV